MLQKFSWSTVALCFWSLGITSLPAQISLTHSQPSAIFPNAPTRLVLHGDKFTAPLRVHTNQPLNVEVIEVTPQRVTLDVQPIGQLLSHSLALTVASADAISAPLIILVDDLPTINEQSDNHSPATAQNIGPSVAVDAVCDGKQFDYFRFHADRGQSITFEVLASELGSKCDPVVRILRSDGTVVRSIDDDDISADSRFRHCFMDEGNYLLEIHDNRFIAGGRYRVRLGNFPWLQFAYPPYVQRGQACKLTFAGPDRAAVLPHELVAPSHAWPDWLVVPARFTDQGSASNVLVRTTDRVQFQEIEPNDQRDQANAVGSAQGINGLLERAGDRDCFVLSGIKDQTWRVASQTRSLGSSTMLKMTLRNAAGDIVGKTTVGDSDEWQFDVKFAEDGAYVLEVEDLLGRGGPEHGYHIDVGIAAPFALSFKPDVKTRDRFAMQPTGGAAAIDLVVERTGYNGPIKVQLEPETPGLSIVNPLIPGGAKEATLFVMANQQWSSDALCNLRIVGYSQEAPEGQATASSRGLLVARDPHVPFPAPWRDGCLSILGVADQAAFFEVPAPEQPVALPRPIADGSLTLTIKRNQAEFKDAVQLVKSQLPEQWSATHKLDKDTLTLAIKHPTTSDAQSATLKFWWYGQWNDRGLVVESTIPVELYDPVKLVVEPLAALKPGESLKSTIQILRTGPAPQDVSLKVTGLPAGVTAPEGITVAAADSQAELTLTAAADAAVGKSTSLIIEATTKIGEQVVSTSTQPIELEILAQ